MRRLRGPLSPALLVCIFASSLAAQPCVRWREINVLPVPQPRAEHAMAFDTARGKTIRFGGSADTYGGSPEGVMWEWDGVEWAVQGTSQLFRVAPAMAYDQRRSVAVLFGGYRLTTVFPETFEWDGTAWALRSQSGPPARYRSAMAYDPARGVTVLFGGFGSRQPANPLRLADTWEWNGAEWTRREVDGPSARGGHSMTYDERRGRVVLYGGSGGGPIGLTDTWEFDGTMWSLRAEAGPPLSTWGAMTYDSARGVSVLAASSYNEFAPLEVWEWDGAFWTARTVRGPVSRYAHSVAFDSVRQRTVLFGGHRPMAVLSDTWELDADAWHQRTYMRASSGDSGIISSFIEDGTGGFLVRTPGGTAPVDMFEVMWRFDGQGWNIAPAHEPGSWMGNRLILFAGALDSGRGVVVFHGGFNGLDYEGVTWEYDGVTVIERTREGPPGYGATMTYDSHRAVCVLLVRNRSATWEWNGTTWTARSNSIAPANWGMLAYDAARHVSVLVSGGWPQPNTPRETWEYDGVSWTMRAAGGPSVAPPSGLAYHPGLRRIILQSAASTWAWDGAAWTMLIGGGPSLAPIATDSQTGTVLGINVNTFALSRLAPPEFPLEITRQPESAVAIPPAPLTLRVEVRSDVVANPTYSWRRDGVPLADSNRVRGSRSPTLTIEPTTPGDTGIYDVVVADRCETVISVPVPVSTCEVDWNYDALLNSQDFFDFLRDFFGGNADFDADGQTDSSDLFAFLAAFLAGCG